MPKLTREKLGEIIRLERERDELRAFVERWHEIICGGQNPSTLEGWAKEFDEEARALIAKTKSVIPRPKLSDFP